MFRGIPTIFPIKSNLRSKTFEIYYTLGGWRRCRPTSCELQGQTGVVPLFKTGCSRFFCFFTGNSHSSLPLVRSLQVFWCRRRSIDSQNSDLGEHCMFHVSHGTLTKLSSHSGPGLPELTRSLYHFLWTHCLRAHLVTSGFCPYLQSVWSCSCCTIISSSLERFTLRVRAAGMRIRPTV